MSFFPIPQFAPPTLEELPAERDEIGLLVALEQRLAKEVRRLAYFWAPAPASPIPLLKFLPLPCPLQLAAVRDASRDEPPLGVVRASEDLLSLVPEDDGAGPVSASSDEGGQQCRTAPSLPCVCGDNVCCGARPPLEAASATDTIAPPAVLRRGD